MLEVYTFTRAHTHFLSRTHMSARYAARRDIPSASGLGDVDVLRVLSTSPLLIGSLTRLDQWCRSVGVVLTGRVEGKDFRLIKRCWIALLLPRSLLCEYAIIIRTRICRSAGPREAELPRLLRTASLLDQIELQTR